MFIAIYANLIPVLSSSSHNMILEYQHRLNVYNFMHYMGNVMYPKPFLTHIFLLSYKKFYDDKCEFYLIMDKKRNLRLADIFTLIFLLYKTTIRMKDNFVKE